MDVVLGVAELGEVGLARAIEHGRRAAPVRVGVGVGVGVRARVRVRVRVRRSRVRVRRSSMGRWAARVKTWVCSLGLGFGLG